MPSLHRRNTAAALGALLLVACGGEAPSTNPDTDTAASGSSDAVSSSSTIPDPTTSTSAAATSSDPTEAPTSDVPPPDMPRPEPCEPTTCAAAGKTCGVLGDGCEGELDCGSCAAPDTCGGGGVDNVCGHPCVAVHAIFFDLGDTLVESDGGDMFVERPGAAAMISDLNALGMRVGVVTNTPPGYTLQDVADLLVDPSLLDAFEVVLLSSTAMSPPKPAPQIFAEAHALLPDAPPIEQTGFVSEDLAEIADQAEAPTQGARAAGMRGIHLSAARPSPLADLTIAPDDLGALVTLAGAEWLSCARAP